MTDGILWDGAVTTIPGLPVCNVLDPAWAQYALLVPGDGCARSSSQRLDLIVVHNTIGDDPIEVRPGLAPVGQMAERNALSWRRRDKAGHNLTAAGTHCIVDQGPAAPGGTTAQILSLCDGRRVTAYGAGSPNTRAWQVEMAATPREGGGSVLYQGQIDATARLCNAIAEFAGIPKLCTAARPRGHELVRALLKPGWRGLADHCAFTRSRGRGDTGYLVQEVLVRDYGWTAVDPDQEHAVLLPAPPSWLLPGDEVQPVPQISGGHLEVARLAQALLNLGLSIQQAMEIAAHGATESAWCLRDVAYNWWGWKARREWAEGERAAGRKARWWQRAGHPGAGDPDVCYYRGFPTPGDSCRAFLAHFCPRNPAEDASSAGRYKTAGRAFWSTAPEQWFPELLEAGYRGTVTAEHPEASIASHRLVVAEVAECWAQLRLGVTVDGRWGAKSRVACKARTGQEELSAEALEQLAA